ncbi:thiamine-phosphate pyrophosphorylase [Roseobacter sp. AzwK-3b]|uniref:phosphotransferase family protein n=1 Tax=Roseobacter sp. AzwK-3b TaxID=351016 RepID=UPI00015691FA|nr:phosphotransferase family protein [Roseobacter sp. AzwK-3b]EDM72598.1 thiamine-phosphate pyrophosphorylase [Roseobacter sp. AzwK-3b]
MSQPLDTDALSLWLAAHLPGFRGPVTATKFSGGQSNPTYRLDTPSGAYVLRRKPPGVLLKSAHAVEREFRVQQALGATDVPVARMHVLCEDPDVIGSAFYVMQAVAGRNFDDPALPDVSPEDRSAMIGAMNACLAAIHEVDIDAVGLSDFGPSGNYYARQLDRWTKQYRATQTDDLPDMDALIGWLGANMPADDGQRRLVHGDYRLDNLLFAPDSPQIAAVLDWELSTIGHPYADLAAVIMQWSMPHTAEGRGLAGVDRAALGLWEDAHFIDAYCARRGLDGIERFEFYLAFCHFRMAAILQGVRKRALDGNASDPERGLQLGAYVPQFARQGLKATLK